jgi:tetratricopeptide (TPR) repeat protein
MLPLLAALGATPAHADDAADIARLVQGGKGEEALKRIDAVLSRQPADVQMRFMKGVMLSETRPAEAIAIFSRLTQDYPKLPEPYNNLAVLYAAAGQYDKAKVALDKAIRTSPAYATALENLGDVHARLASQAYDKALQIDPVAGAPAPATRLTLMRGLGAPVGQASAVAIAPLPAPKPATAPPVVLAAIKPAAADDQPKPKAAPAPVVLAAIKPAAADDQPKPKAVPAPTPEAARTVLAVVAEAPKAAKPAPAAPAAGPTLPPAKADVVKAEPVKPAPTPSPAEPRPVRLVKADKPDPKVRAAQEAAAEKESVLSAVEGWAKAWSAQDVPAYLAHYAGDFNPPGNQSRKAWTEERQARITGKGRIKVSIDAPQVSTEGNTATVRFKQNYVSDRLSSSSRKTLELERQRGKWLIKQERTG